MPAAVTRGATPGATPSRPPVPSGPPAPVRASVSNDGLTAKVEWGDPSADKAWNGDGLHLSLEAQAKRTMLGSEVDQVMVRAGIEGLDAKVKLVRDGELKPRFSGLSLKDGAFRGTAEDGLDYLKANPVAAVGATVGTVLIANQIAKKSGPIKVDTGHVTVWENGPLTASVVGEVAITGKSSILRAEGAKARLKYNDGETGDFSLEAGYDRSDKVRVDANWSKTLDSGMALNAGAYYETRHHDAGVHVGLSYRF